MSSPPSIKQTITVSPPPSPKKMNGKINLFSHVKYEHLVAGISGENRGRVIANGNADFLPSQAESPQL